MWVENVLREETCEGLPSALSRTVSVRLSELIAAVASAPGQRWTMELVSAYSMPQPGSDGLSCYVLVARGTPSPSILGAPATL